MAADGTVGDDWGPLRALAGEWQGDSGLDRAFSHSTNEALVTSYREQASLRPCGPVLNGRQRLYGLDYRTTMWRAEETVPFHSEVGYWLWDPQRDEVLRAFVVPRGVAVVAGGNAAADAVEFEVGSESRDRACAITESPYLAEHASTLSYRMRVRVNRDGSWTYHQVTTLRLSELSAPFAHEDRNTLSRVD